MTSRMAFLELIVVREHEIRGISDADIGIAPLERLRVPAALDGRAGKYRLLSDPNRLGVETDLDAVRLWLGGYDDRAATQQAYQHAVERLFNWSLVERHKALSSLDDDDIFAFEQFLENPQPQRQWICAKGTSRLANNWTPFICPLSQGTRLVTLTILRLMFDWLASTGYCRVGMALSRHSKGGHLRSSALVLSGDRDTMPRCIELDDWHFLRRSLQATSDNGDCEMETRAVIELMYYGGLSATEVSDIRIHRIHREGGITWLHMPSRARHLEKIYLLPPVIQTIDSLLGHRVPVTPNRYNESHGVSENQCEQFLISRRCIAPIVCRAFLSASERASSEENPAVAARLATYKPHSLRHALEMHGRECDAGNSLWHLIGAARLVPESTRKYLTRSTLREEEYLQACNVLSCLWGSDGL